MPQRLPLMLVLLSSMLAGCSLTADEGTFPARFPEGGRPDPTVATDAHALDGFAVSDTEYRLGAGDKLNIDVWGRPEISGPHVVGPDGRISLPITGSLMCRDLTRHELEKAVTEAMQKFYKAVSVTVRVDDYASNSVSVLGNVQNPGTFTFSGQPTLLGALSQAGGLGSLADGLPSPRCSVTRGSTHIVWIDLAELLWHGNTSLNIPLQRDDVVYVPDGTGVTVYVLGQVTRPGVVRLTPGLTLSDAIALAGGLTENALTDSIRILRPTESTGADVNFDELIGGAFVLDAALREGDIIFVPTRGLERWNYFWRKINPFSGLFTIQNQ